MIILLSKKWVLHDLKPLEGQIIVVHVHKSIRFADLSRLRSGLRIRCALLITSGGITRTLLARGEEFNIDRVYFGYSALNTVFAFKAAVLQFAGNGDLTSFSEVFTAIFGLLPPNYYVKKSVSRSPV